IFGTVNTDGSFNPLTNEGGILLQNRSVGQLIQNCVLPPEVIPADATLTDRRLAPQAFGMGLIDAISTQDIQNQAIDKGMGIHGVANMVFDENGILTVGKYGYKAEAATLMQFVGLASTMELGITNPIFQDEQPPQGGGIPPNCAVAPEPNDTDGSQ